MKWWAREYVLLLISLAVAMVMVFWGGLREKETTDIIALVTNLSVTMAGFGVVAFQIARASNELKNDFIESSILMTLSTLSGFFYLVYPERGLFTFNFGEISIFTFFWAFILFLIILIDKRFNILK